MLRYLLIVILIFAFLILAYLKNFERRGIYYPVNEIDFTPSDINLQFEEVFFNASDGVRLNGWFIPAAAPRGTLLFCHGNAGNISHRLEMINIFNSLKLNVFIFDYRGYGKSRGRPSEQGLYRDAQAAYQYLFNREDIDQKAIVVYGKSIGANVAIDLTAKVKPKALISESSFTSAQEMGERMFPYLPIKWIISIKYDALTKIKGIDTPKLIIHSRDDEAVPFQMGQRLFAAATQPKEFYQIRGGHNDALLITPEHEYKHKIEEFLDKYLK